MAFIFLFLLILVIKFLNLKLLDIVTFVNAPSCSIENGLLFAIFFSSFTKLLACSCVLKGYAYALILSNASKLPYFLAILSISVIDNSLALDLGVI